MQIIQISFSFMGNLDREWSGTVHFDNSTGSSECKQKLNEQKLIFYENKNEFFSSNDCELNEVQWT